MGSAFLDAVITHRVLQFFRRIAATVRHWFTDRAQPLPPLIEIALPHMNLIHRDVTSQGVRVYSLCGVCGARLAASATLCEECAQHRSEQPRP